ncbi:hypothetical protein Tco_0984372 [Tanacetum coccineum]
MFDKAFKRVNTFVDYKTELVKGSEKRAEDSTKRAGTELEQEVAKKKKINDVKVDAVSGRKYSAFIHMLRNFDREDLETLWKLVKAKHGSTRLEEGVHFLRLQSMHIFMLVEKRYPFTPATITGMLKKKLQADHWNKIRYQLLKLIIK